MTVVSYAQNGEDMVLARAFPDVSSGLYIDVGASDPVVDSVTKHFYDRGWRGINIEPAIAALEKLQDTRPDDVNLGLAVGAAEGTAIFYELPLQMTGCSTLSPELAEQYRRDGWEPEEREVQITTLAHVCGEHVGDREIDFLKIDVEGDELAVLTGADLGRFRPRVLVVEATRPGTSKPSHAEWEPLVLEARYEFVLFDGLNRFYVRDEDRALAEKLGTPANYFDDYVPHKYASWREQAENATLQAQQANQREQQANQREQQAHEAAAAHAERAQALEQTRELLGTSQAALRDARTELMASRQALTSVLAKLDEFDRPRVPCD